MAADFKLNLIITPKVKQRMDETILRENLGDPNRSEAHITLIQRSLATYETLSKILGKGSRIEVHQPDGNIAEFSL